MAEIPLLFPKSHTTLVSYTQTPQISAASIQPSLTQALNGLSTASLPPWGQSIPLYHSIFSSFHCNNPNFAAGRSLAFALMAHPIRSTAQACAPVPAKPAAAAVQAHCLSHRHIFPLLSMALECVHCTFIAGPNNGAGFNIHLVFLAFVVTL